MKTPLNPPQPKKSPAVVYKYRDWDNDFHKRTLLNCEIFLSSPSRFNDPYDCKIPIAYWKLADDIKLRNEYFPQVVKKHFPKLTPAEHSEKVEWLMKDPKFTDPKWHEDQEVESHDSIAKTFGIISLSEHKDDIRMWSHYSNSHTGFCIGFKSEKLFFNDYRFGTGGKVNYVNEFPIILPTEDSSEQITKILYSKSKVWSYEQEYRLTKINASDTTVRFTPDEVEEIIIGCSTNDSNTESILNICKCNLPGVPVFKAKQKRQDFKISFEK